MTHITSYLFGFYDYVLGLLARFSSAKIIKQIDNLNSKCKPHKIVGDSLSKVYTIS